MKTSKIKLFFLSLFFVFFYLPLNAVELVSESFDSNIDGWSVSDSSKVYHTSSNGDSMFIDQNDRAWRTYSFGVNYATQTLDVEVYWCAENAWESYADYLKTKVNDVTVDSDYDGGGCQTTNFQANADSSGDFKIEFSPITTSSNEDAYIDWFTINGTPIAESPPAMGNIPDTTVYLNVAITPIDISTYVTPTNGDTIDSYALSGTLPVGLSFDISTGILSGIPTEGGTFNLSATATDNDGVSNADNFALIVSLPVVDTAYDVCYDTVSTNGMCSGMISFMCTITTPIRNLSDSNLTDVEVVLASGSMFSAFSDCGVDGASGNCSDASGMGMMGMSMFNGGVVYDMPDYDANATHSTYTSAMFSFFTSPYQWLATYIKDDVIYQGVIGECDTNEVGFKEATYTVLEDKDSPDNSSQALELTIKLMHISTFPITVEYNSVDGTASSASDYNAISGTVTFAPGESEKKVYVDIIHDVAVELEENFHVHLSNVTPNNGTVSIGDYNPTEVIILAQDDVQVCFEDDFSTALDDDWRLLHTENGLGGAEFIPALDDGRLRMTPAQSGISTAVTKDFEFVAAENLITVEFDHYAYEGNGADGFAIVLFDSSVGDSPEPGAFGGSLGYAQKADIPSDATEDIPGFEGGWIGLGLDEYGRFSNGNTGCFGCYEGKDGGTNADVPSAAVIRGKGSGMTGYTYIDGVQLSSPSLWSSTTLHTGGRFKLVVDSRDPTKLLISLFRDTGSGYGSAIISTDAIAIQGASPEYVRLAITASTGGSNAVHEIDELLVSGVCREYSATPPSLVVSDADVVNGFVDSATYNAGSKYITTKVTNKSESFTGVYLNDSDESETYTSTSSNLMFRIIPYLSDSTCTAQEILLEDTNGDGVGDTQVVIAIANGQAAASKNIVMPKNASKDSKIMVTALDFNEVYDESGQSCIINAVTTGNLQGISQCANSNSQYELAFGSEALQRCAVANGAPCSSNNGGRSCGQEQTTGGVLTAAEIASCGYNPLYAGDYGCLMCTLNSSSSCASDNFAIRPNELQISSSNNSFPDLLRSGEDYNMTIKAYDYGINSGTDYTDDYNITNAENNISLAASVAVQKDGNSTGMNGAISWSTSSYDMINGLSDNAGASEVAGLNFNDVGIVTIKAQDQSWAAVDTSDVNNVGDVTPSDCSDSGAYICGEVNATFIPHHFSFVDLNMTNNNGFPGSFTYIANLDPADTSTYDMAVRIDTRIEARNKADGVTSNFRDGAQFYENPLSVNMGFNNGVHGDANTTNITTITLGFGIDNGDVNGTRSVLWNEANASKVLRFNFQRTVNNQLNPFDINGSDLNVTIISTYTGTAAEGTANIIDDDSGKATASGSPTMIYGRTHASRQRIEGATGDPTNIYFENYCFETDTLGVSCQPTLLNTVSPNMRKIDDIRWFVNEDHNVSIDGVVGIVVEKDSLTEVNATTPTVSNPSQTTLTYTTNKGYPYKTTMENNASSWLIYDPDDATGNTTTINSFPVEFMDSTTGWSGKHETDVTTKTKGKVNSNRRSMW